MSKTKMINTILIIFILILLITIISFSFAHFTTRITNNETQTTIASGSGIMEITYNSGENINVPNIFPDNNPFITKEFTITGKNSNNEDMNYHLLLVLDENTFRSSALTFTLESNNINDNGYIVPEIITQTGIKEGEREIFLGNGMFTPTNNEDKVHSYTLKLYFPKIEHFEHGIDQGKTFKAHIETREGEVYPGYNEAKGVNHPVLFTGMTPIKWEGTTELETNEDDPDWYDYDEKRWANAKSADGSYWVWIPRYAYKIESCYHTSGEDCEALTGKQAGDIDVKFLKSTTNLTEDNTPIESTGYEAHVKDTSMHHFLHPAFQFNGEELGFWVAKYQSALADETSSCFVNSNIENCNNLNLNAKIAPNGKIWNYIDVYNSYSFSKDIKNRINIYGWLIHELDSHMMTNLEWGAVAYLSKSQYGAEAEIWKNSYNGYITGCSSSVLLVGAESFCLQYDTEKGLKASTTYNIYGVYDVSGGLWERVMGNYNNIIQDSGFAEKNMVQISLNYLNRYITSDSNLLNGFGMDYNNNIYGDAIYEISANAGRFNGTYWMPELSQNWYGDYSYLPSISHPWIVRSGHFSHASSAGIFGFSASNGAAKTSYTFRPVLTPL